MRNPWRFTFWHRQLILADVGQQRFEEVNLLDLDRSAGANLGWPIFEGPGDGPFLAPALSREHGRNMCAIVGGHVVKGRYLYGGGRRRCIPEREALLAKGSDVAVET